MDKKKFIYDNIERINEDLDTKDIIFYVETNHISHSKNMNGYIINISVLEKEHIDNLISIRDDLWSGEKTREEIEEELREALED